MMCLSVLPHATPYNQYLLFSVIGSTVSLITLCGGASIYANLQFVIVNSWELANRVNNKINYSFARSHLWVYTFAFYGYSVRVALPACGTSNIARLSAKKKAAKTTAINYQMTLSMKYLAHANIQLVFFSVFFPHSISIVYATRPNTQSRFSFYLIFVLFCFIRRLMHIDSATPKTNMNKCWNVNCDWKRLLQRALACSMNVLLSIDKRRVSVQHQTADLRAYTWMEQKTEYYFNYTHLFRSFFATPSINECIWRYTWIFIFLLSLARPLGERNRH